MEETRCDGFWSFCCNYAYLVRVSRSIHPRPHLMSVEEAFCSQPSRIHVAARFETCVTTALHAGVRYLQTAVVVVPFCKVNACTPIAFVGLCSTSAFGLTFVLPVIVVDNGIEQAIVLFVEIEVTGCDVAINQRTVVALSEPVGRQVERRCLIAGSRRSFRSSGTANV